MSVKVIGVRCKTGLRKEGRGLILVPDGESYVIELRLADGRLVYLPGGGEPAFEVGDTLDIVKR